MDLRKTVSNFFKLPSGHVSTTHVPKQDDIAAKLRYNKLLKSNDDGHDYRDTASSLRGTGSSNIHSVKRNDVPNAVPCTNLCNDDIERITEDTRRLLSQSSIDAEHKEAPANSLLQKFEAKNVFQNSYYDTFIEQYSSARRQYQEEIFRQVASVLAKIKHSFKDSKSKTTLTIAIMEENIDDFPEFNDFPDFNDFPEFNDKQKAIIRKSMLGHPNTVLISKFNLSITRDNILTLQWDPLIWLNDEVINFYMNLLTERGELRSNDGYPKVYAMNTFFTQRLCSGGYSAVRKWTKKIDIFACDIIPVPVNLHNMHWCMAIINMKEKTIKYYDSLGMPNNKILLALEQYLKEESLDKRKVEFDFSGWNKENVTGNPLQQNGSDCGVFSCMTAEFICRNRPIVFDQQHMNYFRQKMVVEICTGKMLL